MSTITCPNCGSTSPAGAIFCDNCGNDLRNVNQSPPHLSPTVAADSVNTVKCQTCGYENQPSSAFCENCGTHLAQPVTPQQPVQPPQEQAQPPTPPVSAEAPVQQPVSTEETLPEVPAPEPPSAPASAGPRRLVIQNTNTSLPLIDKPEIILGREDPVSGIFPDIDLTPYGAQESGVGREHAKIRIQSGTAFIEDMNSVNGTLVNKQKIPSGRQVQINNGDEIRLGLMVINYFTD